MSIRPRFLRSLLSLLAVTMLTTFTAAGAAPLPGSLYSGLHWRLIGPFRAGRVIAVAGVPGHPARFYFGAVGGGVWETNDAGRTWTPIFDKEPVASIGAIAVAPSDTNVVYVGSGEADMRSSVSYGNGMYVSRDAGRTWTHIGLTDTQQIGAILVDPHDANTVYVAALGHAYAANAERGVFKSTDGGRTWKKVLYKNADTGAITLAFGGNDPDRVRRAVADAPAAVERVPAVERSGQRAVQIHRRGRDLDADHRPRISQRRTGAHRPGRLTQQSADRVCERGCETGGLVQIHGCRRALDTGVERPAHLVTVVVFRRRHGGSEEPGHGVHLRHRRLQIHRWWQHLRAVSQLTWRR